MSSQRFRHTPGGVCSLGLHPEWCPKYWRGVLGGRAGYRLDELIEQITDEHAWEIVSDEVMSKTMVCRYIEQQWDAVLAS